MNETLDKGRKVAGIAVFCGLVTGFGGWFIALFALNNEDMMGGGVALIAAALAFGLVANAALRA